MTYSFKEYVKIIKMYMVNLHLNLNNLNLTRLKITRFLQINFKFIKMVSFFNKTVAKPFTIFKKCFLPNLNPTNYLKEHK